MHLIVAVDENWAIGYQGRLLERISSDLKRFQSITMGHPVLLGRKTLDTFPGGKPLPGRTNYILSTQADYFVENASMLRSVPDALRLCPEDTFVIGGESVYRALLPYCRVAYVTKIAASHPADTWFPNLDVLPEWVCTEESPLCEENGVCFRFVTYQKRM